MKKKFFLLILFLGVLSFNLYFVFSLMIREIGFIRVYPFANYGQKMGEKIGHNFYQYVQFLKKNIPENATVMIPPSRFPWPQTGNKFYLNYFLYPRRLVDWDETKIAQVDYILALWGESEPIHEYTPGFPKKDINGEFIFCQDNDFSKIYNKKNFVFKDDMKEGVWGIIKLKKD